MRLVAIDFETANYHKLSACSIGLAIFEEEQLIEAPYWLLKPPKPHGWFIESWTDEIHGISHSDVWDAPSFSTIAPEVMRHLNVADLVVAHNAPFDLGVLQALLQHYQLPSPILEHRCTLQLARKTWPELPNHKLSTLAAHLSIDLNHHHAQSDAIAAGRVMLAINRFTSFQKH